MRKVLLHSNNFSIYWLTIFTFISLTSCDAIMFVVMGVKSPKPETVKSILAYEKKVGYDTENNNFYIDSSRITETWNGAFPKGFIYDRNGNTVAFLDCFGESMIQLRQFFDSPIESRKKLSDTLHILIGQDTLLHIAPQFSELIRLSKPLNNHSVFIKPISDYYVVYFWSKSFGRINKKHGSKMEDYIEGHPEFNASFIKINCDYQKDWGYTKKQIKTEWE